VLSKALEDLEDVSQRCLKTAGCDTTGVLTNYETLLEVADLGPTTRWSARRTGTNRPSPTTSFAGAGELAGGAAQHQAAQRRPCLRQDGRDEPGRAGGDPAVADLRSAAS
jgi:hypothetical protein